jgi:predicted RecA/RadA family phage recombinase
MAKNFVQPGKVMTVVAPSGGLTSGKAHVVGGIVGVMATSALEDAEAEMALEGVFKLEKGSTSGGSGWSQGAKLYLDDDMKLTETAAANPFIGYAWSDAADAATTAEVLLVQTSLGGEEGSGVAAAVVFSAGSNLVGVDGTGSNAAPLAGTETRLDALDTAVAAIIANLQAAGLMA